MKNKKNIFLTSVFVLVFILGLFFVNNYVSARTVPCYDQFANGVPVCPPDTAIPPQDGPGEVPRSPSAWFDVGGNPQTLSVNPGANVRFKIGDQFSRPTFKYQYPHFTEPVTGVYNGNTYTMTADWANSIVRYCGLAYITDAIFSYNTSWGSGSGWGYGKRWWEYSQGDTIQQSYTITAPTTPGSYTITGKTAYYRFGDFTTEPQNCFEDSHIWLFIMPPSLNRQAEMSASNINLNVRPFAPTNPTATAGTCGAEPNKINLSWSASSGADSYSVLRSTSSGGDYNQIASGINTNTYQDTGLTANSTYYYKIVAVDATGGSSQGSIEVHATALGSCASLPVPVCVNDTVADINEGSGQQTHYVLSNDTGYPDASDKWVQTHDTSGNVLGCRNLSPSNAGAVTYLNDGASCGFTPSSSVSSDTPYTYEYTIGGPNGVGNVCTVSGIVKDVPDDVPVVVPPTPSGTILVKNITPSTPSVPSINFTLTGPDSSSPITATRRSGGTATYSGLAVGDYTISLADPGSLFTYTLTPSYTQTLTDGGTITYNLLRSLIPNCSIRIDAERWVGDTSTEVTSNPGSIVDVNWSSSDVIGNLTRSWNTSGTVSSNYSERLSAPATVGTYTYTLSGVGANGNTCTSNEFKIIIPTQTCDMVVTSNKTTTFTIDGISGTKDITANTPTTITIPGDGLATRGITPGSVFGYSGSAYKTSDGDPTPTCPKGGSVLMTIKYQVLSPTCNFTGTTSSVQAGGAMTVKWDSSNISSSLSASTIPSWTGWSGGKLASGESTINAPRTTGTYKLQLSGTHPDGTTGSCSIDVVVTPTPPTTAVAQVISNMPNTTYRFEDSYYPSKPAISSGTTGEAGVATDITFTPDNFVEPFFVVPGTKTDYEVSVSPDGQDIEIGETKSYSVTYSTILGELKVTSNLANTDFTINNYNTIRNFDGNGRITSANGTNTYTTVPGVSGTTYTVTPVAKGGYTVSVTGPTKVNRGESKTFAITYTALNSPTVNITSPSDGATYTTGNNITITATASDSDGTVSNVKFYRGGTTLIGTGVLSGGVYSYTWDNVPSGNYSITAVATDNDSRTGTSGAIGVVVSSLPTATISVTSNEDTTYRIAKIANSDVSISADDTDSYNVTLPVSGSDIYSISNVPNILGYTRSIVAKEDGTVVGSTDTSGTLQVTVRAGKTVSFEIVYTQGFAINPDTATVEEGATVDIDVLANDSPAPGGTLVLDNRNSPPDPNACNKLNPSYGTVTSVGNQCRYTANTNTGGNTDTIRYRATDGTYANEANVVIDIVNSGNNSPVITLVGPNPMTLTVGDTYTEPGYTANDAEDGVITGSVVVDSGGLNTSVSGSYTITYTVADSSGLTDTKTRSVVVNEPGVYTANIEVTSNMDATEFRISNYNYITGLGDLGRGTVVNKGDVNSYIAEVPETGGRSFMIFGVSSAPSGFTRDIVAKVNGSPVSGNAGTLTPGDTLRFEITYTAISGARADLNADPISVSSGDSSTLTWSSSGAAVCVGTGFDTENKTSGSVSTGSITADTTYSINCSGATDSVIVTVSGDGGGGGSGAVAINEFRVNPNTVNTGEKTNISWSATNADECHSTSGPWNLSGGTSSGSKKSKIINRDSTLGIECSGTGGSASATADVYIYEPTFRLIRTGKELYFSGITGLSSTTTIKIIPEHGFLGDISLSVVSASPELNGSKYLFSTSTVRSLSDYSVGTELQVNILKSIKTRLYTVTVQAVGGGLTREINIPFNLDNLEDRSIEEF